MNITAVAAIISVTFLVTPAIAGGYKTVNTEGDFLKIVLGKTANGDGASIKVNKNRTLSGKAGKNKISGKWWWQGGYFCRNGTVGSKPLSTNCQLVQVSGNKIKYTRDKGKGKSSVYTLK